MKYITYMMKINHKDILSFTLMYDTNDSQKPFDYIEFVYYAQ